MPEGTGKQRFASQRKAVTDRPIKPPPKLILPERMLKAYPELGPIIANYNDAWELHFKEQEIGRL